MLNLPKDLKAQFDHLLHRIEEEVMENIVQTADDATYFAGWHTAWLNDEGHSDWIKFEDAEYSHFFVECWERAMESYLELLLADAPRPHWIAEQSAKHFFVSLACRRMDDGLEPENDEIRSCL